MKVWIALSVFLLVATISCKRTKDVTCTPGTFSLTGVGFSVTDFNGATITQYQAGTGFSKVLQTDNISYYLWVRDNVTSDTGNASSVKMAVAHNPNNIPSAYDYIISLPAAGISDTISNVALLGLTHKIMPFSGDHYEPCFNPIMSYAYNGHVTTSASGILSAQIYLVK